MLAQRNPQRNGQKRTSLNPFKKPFQKMGEILNLKAFREKLIEAKIKSFKPKVIFSQDYKNYEVRTATTAADLQKVLKLRYQVFYDELGATGQNVEVDFDRYDLMGDHLLIIDKESEKIIGTYRLLCSDFTDQFYSESEFHLDHFLRAEGKKLELGRACIHPDHRNGVTIHLVWKGLAKYIQSVEARFLFGCSSIMTTDPTEIRRLFDYLRSTSYSSSFDIRPTEKYSFNIDWSAAPAKNTDYERDFETDPDQLKKMQRLLPPLLKTYLKAGAQIFGEPALDRDFQCADIFTILDMNRLNPRYASKYMGESDTTH